jgi:hypothetical protein
VKKEIPIGSGIDIKKLPKVSLISKKVTEIKGLYLKNARIIKLNITPVVTTVFFEDPKNT